MMDAITPEQVEVRRRWVEALRSGKYQQGTGVLRQGDRYCCLGVLCDVVAPDRWVNGDPFFHHDDFHAYPPNDVADAAYLPRNSSSPIERRMWYGDGSVTLYYLNDSGDFTFDEIADVIELDTLMRLDGAV